MDGTHSAYRSWARLSPVIGWLLFVSTFVLALLGTGAAFYAFVGSALCGLIGAVLNFGAGSRAQAIGLASAFLLLIACLAIVIVFVNALRGMS